MSSRDQFYREFGLRLQKLRKSRKLTARQLGVMIGLSETVAAQHIYRYERGVHSPHLAHFLKLADALEVSAQELATGSGNYKQQLLNQMSQLLTEADLEKILQEKNLPLPEREKSVNLPHS